VKQCRNETLLKQLSINGATDRLHVFQLSSTKWKPHVHVNHQFSTPLGRSDEGKGKRKRQREERLRVADEDSSGGRCIEIMVFSACQKL